MSPREQEKEEYVSVDTKAEKVEQSTEEKHMLEFARRKIDDAVKVIYPLVKDSKLPNEDIYLQESEDPEVQKIIDKVHEDLDNDGCMLGIVMDRVNELMEKSKAESELLSTAKEIAGILFGHVSSTPYDTRRPKAELDDGIKSHDIDKTVLALRNMARKRVVEFSREEIDKLAALLVKKDMAELFFSTIDQHLYELDDKAWSAATS